MRTLFLRSENVESAITMRYHDGEAVATTACPGELVHGRMVRQVVAGTEMILPKKISLQVNRPASKMSGGRSWRWDGVRKFRVKPNAP
jgi:hypothetical protein